MPEPSRLEQEPLRGVHILLADDDPDSRPLLKTVLEYAGALVSVAFTASGALRALEALRPDIVLCDLVDGVECDWLISRLRELPDGARPPAVLLSSRHDRRRALDAGYGECLAKPVDPWELCRVLAAHARPQR
jgi:DNA-binding response OmpR family regulator